jgi:hypothetical protein
MPAKKTLDQTAFDVLADLLKRVPRSQIMRERSVSDNFVGLVRKRALRAGIELNAPTWRKGRAGKVSDEMARCVARLLPYVNMSRLEEALGISSDSIRRIARSAGIKDIHELRKGIDEDVRQLLSGRWLSLKELAVLLGRQRKALGKALNRANYQAELVRRLRPGTINTFEYTLRSK